MFFRRTKKKTPMRVLAVASAGGHWQQLMALRPALEGREVLYVTTLPGLPEEFGASPAMIVPDCNRHTPLRIPLTALRLAWAMIRFRPDAVITTGALPGVVALALGRTMRASTIWVDSIANAEEMSMSGQMARRVSDLWLSQWQHVARDQGSRYFGAIL